MAGTGIETGVPSARTARRVAEGPLGDIDGHDRGASMRGVSLARSMSVPRTDPALLVTVWRIARRRPR